MVEVADVKGASTGVLAELLASASRELLRTVCHPPTDAAGAAAHDARTAVTCSALQRLLASQREAVKQCGDQQAAIAAGARGRCCCMLQCTTDPAHAGLVLTV